MNWNYRRIALEVADGVRIVTEENCVIQRTATSAFPVRWHRIRWVRCGPTEISCPLERCHGEMIKSSGSAVQRVNTNMIRSLIR